MTSWNYMKSGAIRDENVGPIDTETLAKRIERGEIKPETMVCSPEKTHGEWIEMRRFPKLAAIYHRGIDDRAEAKAQAKAAKAEERKLMKQEKALAKRERASRPEPAQRVGPPAELLPAQPEPVHYAQPIQQPQAAPVQQQTSITVNVGRRPFNHLLHLALATITCGAWLPVWALLWLFHRG